MKTINLIQERHVTRVESTKRVFRETVGLSILFVVLVTASHAFLADVNADPRLVLQPWLLNNGFIEYVNIADEHAPLLPLVLAVMMRTFDNHTNLVALRILHASLVGITVFLVIGSAFRQSGRWAALATGLYLWAFSSRFGYWGMWHNLALAPLYMFCFILLVSLNKHSPIWKIVAISILSSVAVLIKQQAALLIFIFLAWLGWYAKTSNLSYKRLSKWVIFYFLGLLMPILGYLAFFLVRGGEFSALLYWPILFNLTSGYAQLGLLLPTSVQVYGILPAFLLLIPFIITIVKPYKNMRPDRHFRIWLAAFLLASLVFLYPRYSIPHWAVSLAFIALISGIVCNDLVRSASKVVWQIRWGIYLSLVLWWLFSGVTIYWPALRGNWEQTLLKYDHLAPLAEELEPYLPSDGGLVLLPDNDSVSNLYYHLQLPPPHFWIMNYPWFMNEITVSKWIEAMELEQPQTMLFFENLENIAKTAPELLDYTNNHYESVNSITWEGRTIQIMRRSE